MKKAVLLEGVDTHLKPSEQEEFYDKFLPLMTSNMERIYDDLSWFIEKYDYKNRDADWKDSKDAVQRGMQKLKGADPSLPTYQLNRQCYKGLSIIAEPLPLSNSFLYSYILFIY